jgi:hypothetical protein
LPNSDSSGTATVETTTVNSGTHAVALNNTSGQYVYLYTALPSGAQSQTFTRFYFRYGSNVTSGTQLALARNANGGNVWELDFNANRHGLDLYFWNGANTTFSVFSANNVLSANTWYSIEVQDTQSSAGHGEMWLNGTSVGSVDADLSTTTPYARLMLYNSAPGTMYIDDVKVANTYNGTISPSAGVSLNPGSVSFGNQNTGTTSSAHTVTLTNSGTLALSISSIALSGTNASDFAQTNNCPASLSAGASCTINVTFTPGALGTRSASLTVTDNAAGSPQSVALSGTGATQAPAVTLNPTSVNFGNQSTGSTSSAQTITLTNSGTSPLTITSIALSGTNASDFAQTNTCPASTSTLAANGTCSISVTFTPGSTGARTASLTVTDNAAGSPQSVALSGAGVSSTVYFTDGLETGDLSKWTLPNSDSSGTATVETTTVNGGTHAVSLKNTSGQYVYLYTALPSGAQSQTFTRIYFRFGSDVTSGTQLALARNTNGGNAWELDFNYNRHGLDLYFWNGANTIFSVYSSNNVLSANTWYNIEVQDTQSSTGHGEMWLNGTSVGSVDADLSTTTPYARLMLYDSAPGTMYFDDVKVANTFNGNNIALVSPNTQMAMAAPMPYQADAPAFSRRLYRRNVSM